MENVIEESYEGKLVQIETDQRLHPGLPYVGNLIDSDNSFLTLSPYLRIDSNMFGWKTQIKDMLKLEKADEKSKKTFSKRIIATIEEVVLNSNGNW
jgi:hypothetical protein